MWFKSFRNVGAGLLLAGFVLVNQQANAQAPLNVKVALSSTSFAQGAPLIAKEAGLFQKHGVNADFVVMESGNAAWTALLSGSVQLAVTGPVEAFLANVRGQDVAILANTYRRQAGSVVLAKAVSDRLGISGNAPLADRFKALNGLTLAVPSATSVFLTSVKADAEARGYSVKFVYMAQPAMAAAMASGAVDGMVAASPFWEPTITKGFGVMWLSGPAGDIADQFQPSATSYLVTSGKVKTAFPGLLDRVNAVVADLVKLIKDDPSAAKQALARAYPNLDQTTINLAFDANAGSWSTPKVTADDLRHDLKILSSMPELNVVDVTKLIQ